MASMAQEPGVNLISSGQFGKVSALRDMTRIPS